jgi:hypothetical protein
MRIVYNLRDQNWETTKSLGVLQVSLRILEGLAGLPGIERLDVLANRSLTARLSHLGALAPFIRIHGLETPAPSGWSRLLWDHWSVVRHTNALSPDWLLLPKGFSPLARWPRARVSAYVHDNIFAYYRERGARPFPVGQATLFSRSLARTAARAEVVVTNSEFTAAELNRTCHPRVLPRAIGAPVAVTAAGADALRSGEALLLPTSTWPHKLTVQAIDWLQRWQRETSSLRSVHGIGTLPAGVSWPRQEGWHHHGRANDDVFARLRRESAALIYFSAYEGYGLPPVEAATEGLRAVASDLPPLRETMPSGCLFSNEAFASFSATLNRVLASPAAAPLQLTTPVDVARRWLAALSPVRRTTSG